MPRSTETHRASATAVRRCLATNTHGARVAINIGAEVRKAVAVGLTWQTAHFVEGAMSLSVVIAWKMTGTYTSSRVRNVVKCTAENAPTLSPCRRMEEISAEGANRRGKKVKHEIVFAWNAVHRKVGFFVSVVMPKSATIACAIRAKGAMRAIAISTTTTWAFVSIVNKGFVMNAAVLSVPNDNDNSDDGP